MGVAAAIAGSMESKLSSTVIQQTNVCSECCCFCGHTDGDGPIISGLGISLVVDLLIIKWWLLKLFSFIICIVEKEQAGKAEKACTYTAVIDKSMEMNVDRDFILITG